MQKKIKIPEKRKPLPDVKDKDANKNKVEKVAKIVENFSDSDEEPLALKIPKDISDLNQTPTKKIVTIKTKINEVNIKLEPHHQDEKSKVSVKLESDFCSDKKQEKVESKLSKQDLHPETSLGESDLFCKDIGRRFGKGKVNMSAEQIEKWLNDADEELKKQPIKKSSSVETLFEEKQEFDNELLIKTPTPSENFKTITPEKRNVFHQRRLIINKTKEKTPNASAFSPDNESSVYAFEAEIEMPPVNTPFRRNCRRPSSTATSKSEDDLAVSNSQEEAKKSTTAAKFRLPTVFRHDDIKASGSNQQVSLTLGGEDSSNQCGTINVQLDLTGNVLFFISEPTKIKLLGDVY